MSMVRKGLIGATVGFLIGFCVFIVPALVYLMMGGGASEGFRVYIAFSVAFSFTLAAFGIPIGLSDNRW